MCEDLRQDKIITVIGGGPSGMTAAISAARNGAGVVRLIEKNSVPGRKLLATGNGRCNLTNTCCEGANDILDFFSELGVLVRTEEEGRAYPYPEQAVAVQEALINELEELGVEIICGAEVKEVEKQDFGFGITMSDGRVLDTHTLILATGGKAGPQYGSTGDGYRFAKTFGHTVVRLMPSLVQLVSDEPFLMELKGVRAKGRAELLRENEVIGSETGEIQFTEDGLSGICIFNLSKEYDRGDMIKIDLFPEYQEDDLEEILIRRCGTLAGRSMPQYFNGLIHKKLIPVILNLLSLDGDMEASGLSKVDIRNMAQLLKGWSIQISGTKGWKEAQVTAGGVDLDEVDPDTMESKLTEGLYFAGEVLNYDGKCGGYNLQWAWSSGLAAGTAAAIAGKSAGGEKV